ncbi:MAG: alpha/beta hydrolase [Dehalococcoidia bacterium]|nr:alpha/beta hydrolase [Dehalococcoidia bacterium]
MPFATAEDGVRIHYELDGVEDGPPLVLHHGVYSTLDVWRRGEPDSYVDRLRSRFRLILLDARGHGDSDQPTRVEDYDFRTRVLDVVSVMAKAGVERAHFLGYSMGAHVGMSAAIYAPQRFRSLCLGGASPYGAADFTMTKRPWGETWPLIEKLPHAHREAWGALSTQQWRFGGAVQALRTTRVPYMLFAGEGDTGPHRGSTRFASEYDHEGARHFVVPGASHSQALHALDEVVPRLLAFIEATERVYVP